MSSTIAPIDISSGSSSSSSGTGLINILIIVIPLIITPLIGFITWICRGYYEKHTLRVKEQFETKKNYIMTLLNDRLDKFYWPIYVKILRYKTYNETYDKLKNGDLSISSKGDTIRTEPLLNSIEPIEPLEHLEPIEPLEPLEPLGEDYILYNDNSSIDKSYFLLEPKKRIVDESMNKIENYATLINKYEDLLIDILKELQTIICDNILIADPDREFFKELIKLDKFITHIDVLYSQKSNDFVKSKVDFTKFPTNIYKMVEDRFHYYQNTLIELRNNNEIILENEESSITNLNSTTRTDLVNQRIISIKRKSLNLLSIPNAQSNGSHESPHSINPDDSKSPKSTKKLYKSYTLKYQPDKDNVFFNDDDDNIFKESSI